ncbi:MAG: hypothetical protein E7155_04215 [Streptococcus equinus]|nr:glucosyltransferase domain-containing protein [Streptococcus equinus]MBE6162754.1 hypothetical protein [Streptococcus equinus]
MIKELHQDIISIWKDFLRFIKSNKSSALFILIIYLIVCLNIGLAEFPYIDDIGRQIQGYSGFSEHYSRYVSEVAVRFLNLGGHLSDIGLASQILSAIIMTLSSLLLIYIFIPTKKVSKITSFASTLIGINPLFIECLSFRFDSPFMTLSVLFSIIPFIFWNKSRKLFTVSSVISIFLMCNSYQASSGIFLVLTATMLLLDVVNKENVISLLYRFGSAAISYVMGVLLYFCQIKLFPPVFSSAADTAPINKLVHFICLNSKIYLRNIYNQSNKVWVVLALISVVLFVFNVVLTSKLNKLLTILLVTAYLGVSSVLSYGTYLIFMTPYSLLRPRYEYGFGFFLSTILILLSLRYKGHIFRQSNQLVVLLLSFYLAIFSLLYPSALKQQNDVFKSQSIMLAGDLNRYLPQQTSNVVHLNRLFTNSKIYTNSAINYPILNSLIMPNSNISWDMTMRFNELTNLNVDLQPFDETKVDVRMFEKIQDSKLYAIYSNEDGLYVVMK